MKVVINTKFGGFGLSTAAYEKLIEWGVPVRKYIEQKRDPATKLFLPEPANDGEVIFDRTLTPRGECELNDLWLNNQSSRLRGRYWDAWTRENRTHPLVVRVVEELGEAASGELAMLKVVEIPDGVEWEIDEYDGRESIHELHRSWS